MSISLCQYSVRCEDIFELFHQLEFDETRAYN